MDKLEVTKGVPGPLGLSIHGDTANFALFSQHADGVTLGLFWDRKVRQLPMNRTGDIWHIGLKGALPRDVSYAFQCSGPAEYLYNPQAWLADPYAKILVDQVRAKVDLPAQFDWQGVTTPKLPLQDLVIYEMHVRGFTKHASSGVAHPGTYLGAIEKIPYLKKLGVNAVELMPIFEFDETYKKQKPLIDYWGYNPLHYFVPKKGYAASDPIAEFKTLVRELHRNGIEVILDVVYNHTGEGKEKDFYNSFRGIDNPVYYQLDDKGNYIDYSGCGNTVNANHPMVRKLILDSLRYWVLEMHVDGFRFDLASILTLDCNGKPMAHPPLFESIVLDPVVSQAKLIAEPWDAAGLYQLGSFPKWGHWSEWNGRYRDVVRRFIKGTDGKVGIFASVICGSEMIYRSSKTPLSSVNFVTAHDGFTLRDLVTYQNKHNFANGESNRDGNNQNDSWNCGHEGPTDDPHIISLRERQMRNFLLTLFSSQGIPMLLMGDEYGHTRQGNNNPYTLDNEINWFLWDELKKNQKIFQFVAKLIQFRKEHAALRHTQFLTDEEVSWYNSWDSGSRLLTFSFKTKPSLYFAFNANYEPVQIALPPGSWRQVIHTAEDWEFHTDGKPISTVELVPYSAFLAIAK
ncbi:MAG TPA: isoamylase [Chlamydiales bacterium]|nr:isoamylase [Chlamydiales bacterium]